MVEGMGGAGVAGDTKFIDARINSLRLGRYTMSRPIVSISQDTEGFGASADAGVIGGELLRRFTVILDYQSSRILLKPNAQFAEPYETDMSGLELVTRADDFKVIQIKRVRARFPADEAGLREGDTIIAINGHPALEFDLDKLAKMFKQAGKVYLLTLQRGRQVIRVRLKMKRVV
jgi:C-terminal processing protease CtpA/Prc